jgi:hypothetical protein
MSSFTTVTIAGELWTLGPSIGKGGFAAVHMAESRGHWAAIKLVPKDQRASRDLLFADNLRGAKNVIPIYGTGETDSHWALLMPRADQSLRDRLEETSRPLSETQALPILIDVARALVSLTDIGVVHRDLKPDNILLYEGAWCLSDFGISRYADATTVTETWKRSTTRPYAAPEQWRDETATTATDVYALGVVSHELLAGSRPFLGPDFRHEHLHVDPPVITTVAPALAALVEECLFKVPGARPTPQNLLSRLERQSAREPAGGGIAALQGANLTATSHVAREARRQSEARSETEHRKELFTIARRQIEKISAELRQAIVSAAPTAKLSHVEMPSWQLTLPASGICFSRIFTADNLPQPVWGDIPPAGSDQRWITQLPFDVIACGTLAVAGPKQQHGYAGRAHSLWFCDALESGSYGWYETAFIDQTRPANDYYNSYVNYFPDMESTNGIYIPYQVHPCEDKAASAFNRSDSSCLVAWPPTRLEPGDLDEFIDRWANWLAAAAQGGLQEPSPIQAATMLRSWRGGEGRTAPQAGESPPASKERVGASNPPEPKPARRGGSNVLGRLIGSLKGTPPPHVDPDELSGQEDEEHLISFLRKLDNSPLPYVRPKTFVSRFDPPRSATLAAELLYGSDPLSIEDTEWLRLFVDILRVELAERGEGEVLRIANEFRRDIAELVDKEPDPQRRLSLAADSQRSAIRILSVAKYSIDHRETRFGWGSGTSGFLCTVGEAVSSITHNPFDTGPDGQRARRLLATKLVASGGQFGFV